MEGKKRVFLCPGIKDKIIDALKKRFPLNNPASWRKTSNKQLVEWYQEYISKELPAI